MSAPKPITVVLLLAVFACIAVYVLGVGLGATDHSQAGQPSMSKDERLALRDRFIHPRPVKVDELKADCPLANGVLSVQAGRTCRVTIQEASARGRTVEVVPANSGTVSLQFTPKSKPGLPVSENPLREPKKLDVMKEGADLSLTCLGAGSGGLCQVRLR